VAHLYIQIDVKPARVTGITSLELDVKIKKVVVYKAVNMQVSAVSMIGETELFITYSYIIIGDV